MVGIKFLLASFLAISFHGCGVIFDDSYEEDSENDRKILLEIIKANPVLDSIPDSHRFFGTSVEYGRMTSAFDLSGLGLNDSNFHFPKSIKKFRIIKNLYIYGNDFTELPKGCGYKKWGKIAISRNKICNPSSETIAYLDEKTKDSYVGYWRESQRCSDSIPISLKAREWLRSPLPTDPAVGRQASSEKSLAGQEAKSIF